MESVKIVEFLEELELLYKKYDLSITTDGVFAFDKYDKEAIRKLYEARVVGE
jgi:hypothetical protein